nr:unnamed protein product [Digitaria exilis]
MAQWDARVDAALARLEARSLLRATRPIALAPQPAAPETFAGPGPWDRAAVEILLDRHTLLQWLAEGGETVEQEEKLDGNLILFSGNDYMGLSSHPAVREAAVKAHGTLVCGENGGGVAELFECENDIDISVGTLSKAAGCQGGFIACR